MRYKELVSTFLDEEAYLFDVVIVHGLLFREQKFHNIQTFCMQQDLSTMDPATGKTILFALRILFPRPALLELVLIRMLTSAVSIVMATHLLCLI
jgi:hypothetical protein